MVELNPIENSPCKMPNGLQWTEEGLFVMDQYTDNVYVVGEDGTILRLSLIHISEPTRPY